MRKWLVAGACVLALAALVLGMAAGSGGDESGAQAPDTIVFNGRITTMDPRGSTVQALAIRDGEIVASGSDEEIRDLADEGTGQIDLRGRRVLPGLIDGSLPGLRVGAHLCFSRSPRFDAVYTRREALDALADRARRTPAGKWLFQTGEGWNVAQLDVPGMLTRVELDALAPNHPVYLQGTGLPRGGGQLNTLGLRELGLRAGRPGVVRDASGMVTGQVTGAADRRARRAVAADLEALTLDEQEGCTRHFIEELNRRGLTAWDDPGGDNPLGRSDPIFDADRGYQAVSRLHRAGELNARVRFNLSCSGARTGLPCVNERTTNRLSEFGDETLRLGGIGEEVLAAGPRDVYPRKSYGQILRLLASEGWALEQKAIRPTTQQGMIEDWETVNARYPITDLRWRMLRPGGGPVAPSVDALIRLEALNSGVVPTAVGVAGDAAHPPLRRIFDSGARSCLGSAGGPYAPFVSLWYAVSGGTAVPNQQGVAEEQRLTRRQALELATRRCAWFMSLEGRVGSLEAGKLADLIVLSDDYFRVSVERIRTLTSVLTMVGGRIVYGDRNVPDTSPHHTQP